MGLKKCMCVPLYRGVFEFHYGEKKIWDGHLTKLFITCMIFNYYYNNIDLFGLNLVIFGYDFFSQFFNH